MIGEGTKARRHGGAKESTIRALGAFMCANVFFLMGCGSNFTVLHSDMPPSQIEDVAEEHFTIGMTRFEVGRELDDLRLTRSYRPGPDGGTLIAVHVWPKGVFAAEPGWQDHHTVGELRLFMVDKKLDHAQYWYRLAGGAEEKTTELELAEVGK